jgi:hypothetical protein
LTAGQKDEVRPLLTSVIYAQEETHLLLSVAMAAPQAHETNLAREALEKILL